MEIETRDFGNMPGAFELRSNLRNGFEVLIEANRFALDPHVLWAEPDMQFSAQKRLIPNDAGFGNVWRIVNTGQFGGDGRTSDMDGDLAWDITTGSASIKVLRHGHGVQQDHPELNLLPGSDFTIEGGDGGPHNECDDPRHWCRGHHLGRDQQRNRNRRNRRRLTCALRTHWNLQCAV